MTEALNGGGGRRTRLGESTCVLEAPPSSVYKGGRAGWPLGVRQGRERSPTRAPSPSRIPSWKGEGREREGEGKGGVAAPQSLVQFGPARGGAQQPLRPAPLFPVWPNKAHNFPRGGSEPLRHSGKYPNHSEPFRRPNIAFQYIDLYLSDIPRLLVMSVISSGTPNYLRSLIT
jgi:hypothetical protein